MGGYAELSTMSECLARIEKSGNGWEVEMRDPKIADANSKTDAKWRDPWVSYNFSTLEELTAFLLKALPVAVPKEDEFTSSFDKFAKAAGGERED